MRSFITIVLVCLFALVASLASPSAASAAQGLLADPQFRTLAHTPAGPVGTDEYTSMATIQSKHSEDCQIKFLYIDGAGVDAANPPLTNGELFPNPFSTVVPPNGQLMFEITGRNGEYFGGAATIDSIGRRGCRDRPAHLQRRAPAPMFMVR